MFKLFTITAQTLHTGCVFSLPNQSSPCETVSVENKKDTTVIEYRHQGLDDVHTLSLAPCTPVKLVSPYTRLNPAYTPVEVAALALLDSINTSGGILTDEQDNPSGLGSDPENFDLAVDVDALCSALQTDSVLEACLLRQVASNDDFESDDE